MMVVLMRWESVVFSEYEDQNSWLFSVYVYLKLSIYEFWLETTTSTTEKL